MNYIKFTAKVIASMALALVAIYTVFHVTDLNTELFNDMAWSDYWDMRNVFVSLLYTGLVIAPVAIALYIYDWWNPLVDVEDDIEVLLERYKAMYCVKVVDGRTLLAEVMIIDSESCSGLKTHPAGYYDDADFSPEAFRLKTQGEEDTLDI